MMKSSYWGDEHALRILEETLGIRFVLTDSQTKSVLCGPEHDIAWKPKYHAVLILDRETKHYRPVSKNDKFLFSRDEIARFIDL
jgi:hypothetical protein